MAAKITRFELWQDTIEFDSNEHSLAAEYTIEHGLELCAEITEYGCCSSYTSERYFFLDREEAVQLARFILEQVEAAHGKVS